MEEHIKELLGRYQYSDELKEEAAFRVLFGGEDFHEVAEMLGVQSAYSINSWVLDYKKRINEGLINLPPMTDRQKKI